MTESRVRIVLETSSRVQPYLPEKLTVFGEPADVISVEPVEDDLGLWPLLVWSMLIAFPFMLAYMVAFYPPHLTDDIQHVILSWFGLG